MTIDYDEFRRTTWEQRVAIFSALSPEEKAELFRSQVRGWIERHRGELTPEQVAVLEEAVCVCTPEMYVRPRPDALLSRMKEVENRARALLSKAQIVDALTMQWGMT